MSRQQQSGMRGVYLVAAELAARGLIVSPTSRSAVGADLLVSDALCARAFSVQVKTNSKPSSFWLVGSKASSIKSKSHVYVLVNIQPATGVHEYFIVPSTFLARKVNADTAPGSHWFNIRKATVQRYRGRWDLLGAEDAA